MFVKINGNTITNLLHIVILNFYFLNFLKTKWNLQCNLTKIYMVCTRFVLKKVWVYFDHLLNYREGIKKCMIQKTFKLPWLNLKFRCHIRKWWTIVTNNVFSYSSTWIKISWRPPFQLNCKMDSLSSLNGGAFKWSHVCTVLNVTQ